MIKFADSVAYKMALSLKDQYSFYTGLFLYELNYFFKTSKENEEDSHDAWFFFNKGKMILFFNKREQPFFERKINLIKIRQDFLDRNIISINNDPLTLEFIKSAEIIYYLENDFSTEIWLHQDDANFITKSLNSNLTINQIRQKVWFNQMEYKVKFEEIKTNQLSFYLFDYQNKKIINSYIIANIINDLKISFYLSNNKNIIIPYQKYFFLKRQISLIYPHCCFFQSPIEAMIVFNN